MTGYAAHACVTACEWKAGLAMVETGLTRNDTGNPPAFRRVTCAAFKAIRDRCAVARRRSLSTGIRVRGSLLGAGCRTTQEREKKHGKQR